MLDFAPGGSLWRDANGSITCRSVTRPCRASVVLLVRRPRQRPRSHRRGRRGFGLDVAPPIAIEVLGEVDGGDRRRKRDGVRIRPPHTERCLRDQVRPVRPFESVQRIDEVGEPQPTQPVLLAVLDAARSPSGRCRVRCSSVALAPPSRWRRRPTICTDEVETVLSSAGRGSWSDAHAIAWIVAPTAYSGRIGDVSVLDPTRRCRHWHRSDEVERRALRRSGPAEP